MVIEEKTSLVENAFAIGGVLIAIIATFSSPKLDSTISRAEILQQRDLKVQRIAELQSEIAGLRVRIGELQDEREVARTSALGATALLRQKDVQLEELRGQLAQANQDLETERAQVAARKADIVALEAEIDDYKAILDVEDVKDERDAALQLAKEKEELAEKRAEQIRQLTLQLSRAGVIP